jgi:hypothetical protein
MASANGIGLAELLGQIREEIEESRSNLRKSGKQPLMDWESAEIEISFTVAKNASGSGNAKFLVFAVEAGGDYKAEQVHRLKIQLKPHLRGIVVGHQHGDPNEDPSEIACVVAKANIGEPDTGLGGAGNF